MPTAREPKVKRFHRLNPARISKEIFTARPFHLSIPNEKQTLSHFRIPVLKVHLDALPDLFNLIALSDLSNLNVLPDLSSARPVSNLVAATTAVKETFRGTSTLSRSDLHALSICNRRKPRRSDAATNIPFGEVLLPCARPFSLNETLNIIGCSVRPTLLCER
ncbi:hypothetical protein MRB53_003611 [Persea americana]|uniref:Uncharacterized protein n=1 Tax=Persea americana TaxID=3435 RepID=A0ACC2MY47_PERAE|nr:hypothetical protein MRB53_003611 [Persea americana]